MDLSLVMGTYNRLSLLKNAILSIIRSASPLKIEIIINDGGSTDGTVEWLKTEATKGVVVPIFSGKLEGITKAYNKCFQQAKGKYTIWLSDDQRPLGSALKRMFHLMEKTTNNRDMGAFASRNFSKDPYTIPTVGGRYCPVVSCIRTDTLKKYGYWDEDFPYYGQESEFNSRIYRMGGVIYPFHDCQIEHLNEQDHLKKENLRKYKLTGFFGKYQMIYRERFAKRSRFLKLAFLIIPVDGAKLVHVNKTIGKMYRYFKNPHYFVETNNAEIINGTPDFVKSVRTNAVKSSKNVSLPQNKYWEAYDLVVVVSPVRSWVAGPNASAIRIPFAKEMLK